MDVVHHSCVTSGPSGASGDPWNDNHQTETPGYPASTAICAETSTGGMTSGLAGRLAQPYPLITGHFAIYIHKVVD